MKRILIVAVALSLSTLQAVEDPGRNILTTLKTERAGDLSAITQIEAYVVKLEAFKEKMLTLVAAMKTDKDAALQALSKIDAAIIALQQETK